uniref:Uncharacterized protein n=1 Tax=Cacopsylla melanoneura TaxID=428564 RepID=A0A8D9FIF7_9HEMI
MYRMYVIHTNIIHSYKHYLSLSLSLNMRVREKEGMNVLYVRYPHKYYSFLQTLPISISFIKMRVREKEGMHVPYVRYLHKYYSFLQTLPISISFIKHESERERDKLPLN